MHNIGKCINRPCVLKKRLSQGFFFVFLMHLNMFLSEFCKYLLCFGDRVFLICLQFLFVICRVLFVVCFQLFGLLSVSSCLVCCLFPVVWLVVCFQLFGLLSVSSCLVCCLFPVVWFVVCFLVVWFVVCYFYHHLGPGPQDGNIFYCFLSLDCTIIVFR